MTSYVAEKKREGPSQHDGDPFGDCGAGSASVEAARSGWSTTRPAGSGGRITGYPKVGCAQAEKAMGLERTLPGKELLLRKLITAARFLQSDLAVPHSSYDCGFLARDPFFGVRWRQVIHGRSSDQIPRLVRRRGARFHDTGLWNRLHCLPSTHAHRTLGSKNDTQGWRREMRAQLPISTPTKHGATSRRS